MPKGGKKSLPAGEKTPYLIRSKSSYRLQVQARVNEILGAAGTSSTPMDVDAMARAVIRGDYGNGEERKRRLGSYYDLVQSRVNEMLL